MAEKMDSDRSFSEESSSSSSESSSSGSTDGEDDTSERVRVLGHTFELPQDLCEDYSLFKEVFSMKTWESLETKEKEHLKKFLPQFKENSQEEQDTTVKMLFNYEPFKFTSPLSDFYNDLKLGNFRPDLAKMRKLLTKARKKQQRQRLREYYAKLLPSILISRERLLAAISGGPPGPAPFIPPIPPKPTLKLGQKSVYQRAKQRYFDELNSIQGEVGGNSSDDDLYPEGPDAQLKDKQPASPCNPIPEEQPCVFGTLQGSSQSYPGLMLNLKEMIASHKIRRMQREVHPELNVNGITLDDIQQRVSVGGKRSLLGDPKSESPVPKLKRGPKRDSISKGKVCEGKTIKKIKEENDIDGKPTLTEIKNENESDSESSSFVDPMASPKASTSLEQVEIKQEVIDDDTENYPSNSIENSQPPPDTVIKEEPPDVYASSSGKVHIPIKLEDLDGIDMMALPIQLADESGEVIQVDTSADALHDVANDRVVEVDESLTETTHANFLSMVRALFPARDAHRASRQQLHARCGAVMKSPIAPLNTWYPLSDDWCAELDSALEFLAGERGTHPDDFVPYLQYMPKTQMYQWIGAGRDCDSILDRLCDRWLRAMSPRLSVKKPPPPKYPTSWTVRPPTNADISEFRVQERRRFTSASKPFTYIQHGYRSVVGPCARAWVSSGCAGTSMLVPDRPRHATFTSLVRDALARLPNGEGTRHDVMTLLKMSQYIAQCSEQALLGAVSAVLERFHTAKRDPVVKFDQRTAVWMYLHRNRTEDDWTKTTSGRSRGAKATAVISATTLPPTSPPPAPIPRPPIAAKPTTIIRTNVKPSVTSPPPLVKTTTPVKENAPENMEVDSTGTEEFIEASDSDVDVDDSSVPTSAPQLSSAQLLMQATLGQAKVTPTSKPKKPVYTPPSKRPFAPKHASLTKQSKQAALMSQSVKQAKLLAEAVKQASATAQNKAAARNLAKQAALLAKASTSQALQAALQSKSLKNVPKTVKLPAQSPKAAQSPKQPTAVKQMPTSPIQPPPSSMQPPPSPKLPPSPKQSPSSRPQSPIQPPSPKIPARLLQSANKPAASAKQPPLPNKQMTGSPKQTIPEKPFSPVYLSTEEFSLSGTELPQPAKQPTQIDIKNSQTVFLKPQSPVKHLQSPKQSPSSPQSTIQPIPSSQSIMPPPQSSVQLSQSSMPPPKSPIAPTKSSMPPPKSPLPSPQSIMPPPPSPVQHAPLQTAKQLSQAAKHLSQVGKQLTKTGKQLPLIIKHPESKPSIVTKPVVSSPSGIKTISPQQVSKPVLSQANATLSRSSSLPTIVATSHKTPLIKQRTSIKADAVQASLAKANAVSHQISTTQTVIHPVNPSYQSQKMVPGTRSLLIRPPSLQSSVSTSATPTTQATGTRRGMVRVLSPANQSSGKSLISPRALLQDTPTTKKRTTISTTPTITTLAQSPVSGTAVVSSVQTAVSTSVPMRTVQLAGGRTLQLSANQTVHFPGGQAVQLSPSHALQLSSLQLPSLQMQHTTHSVRLPSGQTVPLATPQVMQALKASKNQSPRVQTTPTLKTLQPNQTVIPVSSVQLAGQTVQFGNQTVQLAGQSVQLTGHTVKLPSGQSVQVASQNVLPSSVQLAGQTFQLSGGGLQTVQMGGQNVQIPSSALGSQTVQLAGQTVQLANNQTVQLAGSQTVQLPSGQTLQLPSGQTLQLAGGVQLANQAKAMPQVVRSQSQGEKMSSQPIMAKLLTNAQGQMVSLEGMVGSGRIVSGIRPRPQVRVLSPATRLTRPLLLTSAKPLHNIILQSDGSAVRVTSTGGASTSQTIVISNMAAQTVTTPTTTTPVLKLQQVNPIQQVKLAQGIKIQQASSTVTTPTSTGVRSVLMDGTQLKLVSGRHVLARILRPNHPPPE